MEALKGKKVLFLAPTFFGYEIEIKKELENFGAEVKYFDERPKNDFVTKALIRLQLKKAIQNNINIYYRNIIENTKHDCFDYLFLVNPETIDVKIIEAIKKCHPNVIVYTYMWDSIKNKKKSLDLLSASNKFFTFDSNDGVIDESIRFLPLFYIKDYEDAVGSDDCSYDISFIGSVHSDRYSTVKSMDNGRFKLFSYFYSQSRFLFMLQRLLYKEFRRIQRSDVSFVSLSKNEVINIIRDSKAIVDIEHPLQNGLTMRTIEMLGAKKKLITTNSNVKEYDFYDSRNIFVIDRNNPVVAEGFLDAKYIEIDKSIYEKYSLRSWIVNIFRVEGDVVD
ncbi:lipopolysaccharide biosynthesis protein [Vibrio tapetis]|uniref:Putative lipopolysaccharide biosynthesis protein n=1 Tax=Vibrio tapetis subsp. tapetis TaxID=1671868 RepID=A0A2N8ZGH3_9VIBR|nr:lipopolysaccharide biosynthesis protein [Vibrio tapetis]SON51002.1 putative lipopolysaccharide biosynthesis protein [Vibrio tapetis subsp. tapetis]